MLDKNCPGQYHAGREPRREPDEMRAKTNYGLVTRIELVKRFPKAFFDFGQPKRPLKIGIFTDITERCPDLPKWQIALALRYYTRRPSYLAAIHSNLPRLDLDGNTCGDDGFIVPAKGQDGSSAGSSVKDLSVVKTTGVLDRPLLRYRGAPLKRKPGPKERGSGDGRRIARK
jgi:hypothetical protein